MNSVQRLILAAKPIGKMQRLASFLNWRGLRLEYIVFTPEEIARWNVPESGIIAYYVTTDRRCNLQINEIPSGQSLTHQASITADRYGIRNVGWHPFTLFDDDNDLRTEAERLRPWLDRRLYKNAEWLRAFKRNHPEMLLPSRKKRRGRPKRQALPCRQRV